MSDETDRVADESSFDDLAERDDLADEAEAADEGTCSTLTKQKPQKPQPKLRQRRSSGAVGSPGLVCWLWHYRRWR